MASRDLAIGMVYLAQTAIGFLGNLSHLYHYTVLYFTMSRLRATDLIVKHLIVSNSLVILCKGVPQTMGAFGWKDFLDDLGCKLVFYLHRVSRGVSLSSTCLLSVVQVITISPRDSRWAELKVKAPRNLGIFSVLCWVLHMLVNTTVLINITDKWSNKNITYDKEFGYCSAVHQENTKNILHATLLSFLDLVFVELMLWASGSMIFILHRHKQWVQHLHSTNMSPRSSPEFRAIKAILFLVSTFVCFYTLSCIFTLCLIVLHYSNWVLVNTAALVAGGFPTVSPFLLMSGDSSASRLCFFWIRNRKP